MARCFEEAIEGFEPTVEFASEFSLLQSANVEGVITTNFFLAQFTDEDLATLRELIGVTVHDPAASELYGLWNEASEREEWARVSQDEGLPD